MNLHQEVIMKGTLLVKNVKHLVTCDGDDRLLDGVDVFVRDGVIAGIGQEAGTLESGTQESGTAEDVIDASNMVMYPGTYQYTPSFISDVQPQFTAGTEHGVISMAENII